MCECVPENPGSDVLFWKFLNKYNRTLGEAFVDGRFCVFAVNSENFGSDSRYAFL
jgi:hypothetical protein